MKFRGFCPKLISGNELTNDYRIIFIGTPNWFKTFAPPVMSFLKQHDFTGKIVIPFCTHGGGGFGQIENYFELLFLIATPNSIGHAWHH